MGAVARGAGANLTRRHATVLVLGALCGAPAGCGLAGPPVNGQPVTGVAAAGPATPGAAGSSDPVATLAVDAPSAPAPTPAVDPLSDPLGPAADQVDGQDSPCRATVGQRLLVAVNEQRARRGLPSLRPHPELVAAARAHADDQAARGTVTHVGSDGSAGSERVTRAGYSWATTGENVAGGYDDPAEVVAAWLDSPPHRAILLEPDAVHAGVGFTQASQDGFRWFWALTVAAPGEGEDTPAARCHP